MKDSVIHYFAGDNIDSKKWNDCIKNSQLGIPNLCFARFEYLQSICNGQWGALILLNFDESKYLNVMPLPFRKKWGFIHYIYQPYFCQQLGVFGELTHYCIDDFIEHIPKRFFRMHLNIHGGIGIPKKSQKRTNFILPAPHDPKKTFNKDALKNLRKLNQHTIEYVQSNDYQTILKIYDEAWGEQSGLEWFNDYKHFENALNMIDSNRIYSILVYEQGTSNPLAGAIFLQSGLPNTDSHRLHYVCGGALKKGRDLGIVHGIIEHVCLKFPNSIIDFEGSNIPSVAKFYQKFGPIDEPYYSLSINYRL